MMHRVLFIFAALLLFTACHKTDPNKEAVAAAEQYAKLLLDGKFEEYADAHWQPERIPDSYRQQLIDNFKMFARQQQDEHRGIQEIRTANAKLQNDSAVNVFLVYCYGDSTNEEIVVPMVKRKGKWLMK